MNQCNTCGHEMMCGCNDFKCESCEDLREGFSFELGVVQSEADYKIRMLEKQLTEINESIKKAINFRIDRLTEQLALIRDLDNLSYIKIDTEARFGRATIPTGVCGEDMIKLDNKKEYYLITSAQEVRTALDYIEKSDMLAFDTETTGLNTRKDKIIGFSFTDSPGTGFYFPLLAYNKAQDKLESPSFNYAPYENAHLTLLNAIAGKKLVMHNASFDTRIVINNFGIDLLQSLLADTMLMKHTIMEEGSMGLKDIAVEYAVELGLDEQDAANQEQIELEQSVKANGGKWLKSNKEMYKADLNVLGRYAIADTDITKRVYLYFQQLLEEEGLMEFFYEKEVMPLYKFCTIIMEYEGMYMNMPLLIQMITEINRDINLAEENVVTALLATEEGQEFVRQRLAEEFPPKNSGSFAQELVRVCDLPFPKLASGKYQITKKTIEKAREQIELHDHSNYILDFLDGKEVILVKEFVDNIQKNLLIAAEGSDRAINISSKQQMGKIVFDLMGIEPLTKTEKGAPQFNEDFIEHLAEKYKFEWAKELRVYNKLVKILGSSFQRFYDEQEGGVFYPYFKQHGTTSGRYSSNVQQLSRPIEEGSDDARIVKYTNQIRRLFIPKPGYIYIDDDYSSLEPCVFAHDAADQALLDIFIKAEDFYSKVAIMALRLLNCSADKKAPNFLKNLYPHHRQNAKAYSLGIRYGAEANKVAQLLSISQEEAQELVDNYFKAFPGLKARMDDYRNQAKKTGMVKSEFGRIRHLPRVKKIYDKFGDDILDYIKLGALSRKHYVSYNELKDIRKEYKNLLNNALNFPIQSAATSIINQAGIAIMQEFREKGIDGWITAFVHDQLIVSVREDQQEIASEIVQRCMEKTNTIKVPLVAVPQFAYNMADGH